MATDRPSIDQLVDEILSHPDYATGARTPSGTPTVAEVMSVMRNIFDGTVQIDGVMPQVAAGLGVTIACHEGCPSPCCESLVMASLPEAWAIAEYLRDRVSRAARVAIEQRMAAWLERAERAEPAAAALARGELAEYHRVMMEHGRQHHMCPFHDGHHCAVYPVRPLRCRQVWVANDPTRCGASDLPDPPKVDLIAFAQMDEIYDRAYRALAGLQHAMGRGIERAPMPRLVRAALAAGELE